MGFFKDFKNDMKQAVNELIPGNDEMVSEYDDEDMVNTLEETVPEEAYVNTFDEAPAQVAEVQAESTGDGLEDFDLSDLDDLEIDEADLEDDFVDGTSPEEYAKSVVDTIKAESAGGYSDDMNSLADLLSGSATVEDVQNMVVEEPVMTEAVEETFTEEKPEKAIVEETVAKEMVMEEVSGEEVAEATETMKASTNEVPQEIVEEVAEPAVEEAVVAKPVVEESVVAEPEVKTQEEEPMADDKIIEISSMKEIEEVTPEVKEETEINLDAEISDSTTYITKGTRIEGNLFTDGSIDIIGTVEGDVSCYGKLVVSGVINGKVNASEVYANAAKINGEITSAGSVKIGVGSVIVGNVEAQSAVVAGAVNGDLDVKGPVIVDSTAVIMGNIKSRSVQINNGAVIEGFCSQCYSDIDVKSFFA